MQEEVSMPSNTVLTVVGLIVLAVLFVFFLRARRQDLVGAIMKKRGSMASLVTPADYVEGAETIPVVLSLAGDTFYYENPDMEASFELARIDEVEYADDLMTGKSVHQGCRVLRLRSHGKTIEFVLSAPDCAKWQSALKGHRMDDEPSGASAQAV
jgi:hypothetical protein